MNRTPITRLSFVKDMVQSGLTYAQATTAYNAVMSTIADGAVNGQKIYLGQVGVINPTVLPPRQVKMGFTKGPGGKIVRRQTDYFLDSRMKYSFRMFKKFVQTHELNWVG